MTADDKIAESRWQNGVEMTDDNITDDKMTNSRWLDGPTLDYKMTTDWKGRVLTRWQQGDRLSKLTSSRLTY